MRVTLVSLKHDIGSPRDCGGDLPSIVIVCDEALHGSMKPFRAS